MVSMSRHGQNHRRKPPKSRKPRVSMPRQTLNFPRVFGTLDFHVVGRQKVAKVQGTQGAHFMAQWKFLTKLVDTWGFHFTSRKQLLPNSGKHEVPMSLVPWLKLPPKYGELRVSMSSQDRELPPKSGELRVSMSSHDRE